MKKNVMNALQILPPFESYFYNEKIIK